MNWTPNETAKLIEDTWGKYTPGMLALVLEHLKNKRPIYCRALYAVLGDFHDGKWPPSRADMIRYRDEIAQRQSDYADRIPEERRLESETERPVDPEVGAAKIREIIGNLGAKVIQNKGLGA